MVYLQMQLSAPLSLGIGNHTPDSALAPLPNEIPGVSSLILQPLLQIVERALPPTQVARLGNLIV